MSPLQHGVLFVGKDHDDAVMLYSIEREGGRKGKKERNRKGGIKLYIYIYIYM